MFPEGNVPGYVCNPGSPRERDAASQGHTSGIPTRALLHSWKLAPAAHHALLSILVVTSPTPDVWLSILTDYTYDSELDIADGVPLAFRRSVSFPRGTRVTYVTWDVFCLSWICLQADLTFVSQERAKPCLNLFACTPPPPPPT